MIDEDEAVKRFRSLTDSLKRLSELAEASDSRMEIDEIVNAVLGEEAESDRELESLVRSAFQSSSEPLSLSQMAIGILAVKKWREVWV